MSPSSEERSRWQDLGSREPYWAVCSEQRFRASALSEHDRAEFFASGEREVSQTFALITRHIRPEFRPALALDYGCGVGRLALPIARRSRNAIGVDISDAMLVEARANAERQGVKNVVFQRPEEALAVEASDLDLLHSYIVLQHIEPATGIAITRALLRRLRPGGIGCLHFTFRRDASALRRVSHVLRKRVPGFNAFVNLAQGKPLREPMIPVHEYDRDEVSDLFAQAHCQVVHEFNTDHAGLLGSVFLFVRSQ
jgi:SAM-dependent methyltransferase